MTLMHRVFPEVNHNRVQTAAILAGSENHQFGFICIYFETVRVKPGIERTQSVFQFCNQFIEFILFARKKDLSIIRVLDDLGISREQT